MILDSIIGAKRASGPKGHDYLINQTILEKRY